MTFGKRSLGKELGKEADRLEEGNKILNMSRPHNESADMGKYFVARLRT